MTDMSLETSVGNWAAIQPQSIRIIEQYGIDYCCGGETSLAVACRGAKVDAHQVLDELQQIERGGGGPSTDDWAVAPLTALSDHIRATHHAYLREQLPFLEKLIDKVVAVHGLAHPELSSIKSVFAALRAELEPHMMKEEQVLFPAIRTLEGADPPPAFPFGSVQNPIRVMKDEHDNAGTGLHRLRELTGNYAAPDDACGAYRALLEGLQQLETDLHMHIHKENNILFPRAAHLEQSAQPAGS